MRSQIRQVHKEEITSDHNNLAREAGQVFLVDSELIHFECFWKEVEEFANLKNLSSKYILSISEPHTPSINRSDLPGCHNWYMQAGIFLLSRTDAYLGEKSHHMCHIW